MLMQSLCVSRSDHGKYIPDTNVKIYDRLLAIDNDFIIMHKTFLQPHIIII